MVARKPALRILPRCSPQASLTARWHDRGADWRGRVLLSASAPIGTRKRKKSPQNKENSAAPKALQSDPNDQARALAMVLEKIYVGVTMANKWTDPTSLLIIGLAGGVPALLIAEARSSLATVCTPRQSRRRTTSGTRRTPAAPPPSAPAARTPLPRAGAPPPLATAAARPDGTSCSFRWRSRSRWGWCTRRCCLA